MNTIHDIVITSTQVEISATLQNYSIIQRIHAIAGGYITRADDTLLLLVIALDDNTTALDIIRVAQLLSAASGTTTRMGGN